MKEKREKKSKGKTLNTSVSCTGMASPKIDLVERAELNKLTSANLYKLLQLKKVPNRSKLAKKEERVNALLGIITEDDLLSSSYPVKEGPRPEELIVKPCKGKRFNVPVGAIDVHKVTLVVSIADRTGIKDRRNFLNAENGIEDLIHFFKYHHMEHAALESTAEYWLKAFWMLSKAGIKVLVANPLQTKTTQGLKTDKEDADRIAIAFRDGRLKSSLVCTPDQYSMRKLSRAAFKRTQQSTRAINRLNAMYEMFDAADWIKDLHVSRRGVRIFYRTLQLSDKEAILGALTEEYSKGPHQISSKNVLEERAVDFVKFFINMDISPNNRVLFGEHLEDYVNCKRMAASYRLKLIEFGTKHDLFKEQFKKNLELLLTAPNVDINTALTILVEHVEIGFFWNAKAMARWSGLAPSVKQSGYRKRRNGKIYKGGNKWLRTAVWLATENCYRHLKDSDEPIGSYVKRLYKEKNKHYYVAITAGARKLMTYIYHILKQQRPFDEIFEMERAEQLKANQKRKLGKLRKILNNSAVPELLPLIANALKRDHYRLEEIEKQVALEIARKLGVAPRVHVDDSFTFG